VELLTWSPDANEVKEKTNERKMSDVNSLPKTVTGLYLRAWCRRLHTGLEEVG